MNAADREMLKIAEYLSGGAREKVEAKRFLRRYIKELNRDRSPDAKTQRNELVAVAEKLFPQPKPARYLTPLNRIK